MASDCPARGWLTQHIIVYRHSAGGRTAPGPTAASRLSWMRAPDGRHAKADDAGHILGSAQVVLDIRESDGKEYRYLFTGDVGRGGHAILNRGGSALDAVEAAMAPPLLALEPYFPKECHAQIPKRGNCPPGRPFVLLGFHPNFQSEKS